MISFCFFLKEWQGQEEEGLIYSNLSLQLQCSANFITEENIHKEMGEKTVNMKRIYFRALSEILLKKQSDFMQFQVIFHRSKVNWFVP